MRDAGAGPREERDARRVELDAVRVPDVGAGPAERLGVFGGRLPEPLAAVGDVVGAFREVRVQAHAVAARERRGLAHQRLASR